MSITRISIDSEGNQSNNTSYNPSISEDGNYVAFASDASNLVADDTNDSRDIFVRDIEAGTTTRISVSNEGLEADDDSENPSISVDGNYIAFTSDATNLVTDDTNSDSDIFIHNRETGETTRVSVDSLGNEANNDSENPSISVDEENNVYVVFASDASNLVAGDTNNRKDIFLRNVTTGETTRLSVDSSENQANRDSENPSISADGNYVVFASEASNLVADDTNNSKDIFLRDLTTGETTRISVDGDGNEANGDSENPSISADGNYIAFASDASNLVEGDENGRRDIFVRNLETGETSRISVDSDGNEADDTSDNPSISISENGSYVAFTSNASNLFAGDENNAEDIFIHNLTTDETTPIDLGIDGNQANDFSSAPELSGDGNYIAFAYNADNLVADDTNKVEDIFVTDNSINDIPTVLNAISEQTATEDSEFNFTVPSDTFLDVDPGDSLTLSATLEDGSELPTWLSFDDSANTFSGTPTNDDVGTENITVTATDTESESVSDTFTLTVVNTNDTPTVANIIEDQTASEDSKFNFTIDSDTFSDVDAGDSLTLDVSELPSWLSFDSSTNTFSGTPTNDDVGTFNITVTATDTESESVSDTFTLTVGNTNDMPTVDDVTLSVDENSEEGTEVGTITATDSDNEVLTFAIASGNLDSDDDGNLAFAIDSETGVITVNDSDELDFETNPSFDLEVTATDADESSDTASVTVNLNDIDAAEFDTSASDNGFFTLNGGDSTNIKFTLADNDTENVDEIGVFLVDDKFGSINGVTTTDSYFQAALERSKVIFSGVPNRPSGFDLADIQRILEFDGDASFGFYLVSNGTTDTVLNDLETTGTTDLSVFFSTSDNLDISDLSTAGFTLNWSDGSGSDFNDMEVLVELTDETLPFATDLQGEAEKELIDLTDVTGEVAVSVEVHREAAFDNLVGFYQIADANGGIDTTGDGIADINVGDTGYEQAALENRITSLDLLQTDNQQTSSFDGILDGGSLLASFIIVDGTVDEAINDSAEVYFSFLGANSDGVDHIRLLGDNTFGFEDLAGGGDNDFNDMIVNLKFNQLSS